MSKRALLIAGAVAITGVVIVWQAGAQMFTPTPVRGQPVITYWYPGFATWLAAIVGWYGICWINAIKQWKRRPVLLFGKYYKTAGPGLVFIEPLVFTTLPDIIVQDVVVEIVAPNIQTKDNVGVGVVAALTFCINEANVKDAVVGVQSVNNAVLMRALATMGDVGSTTNLDNFLEHRDQFSTNVVNKLKDRVKEWGVSVKALELKSFKINDSHVEQAIAMKARAEKEASAELVRANMQKQIAEALNEAASKLDEKGWTLKGMEILVELCRSANNNTIMIPSDIQSALGTIVGLRGAFPGVGGSKPAVVETKQAA